MYTVGGNKTMLQRLFAADECKTHKARPIPYEPVKIKDGALAAARVKQTNQ